MRRTGTHEPAAAPRRGVSARKIDMLLEITVIVVRGIAIGSIFAMIAIFWVFGDIAIFMEY